MVDPDLTENDIQEMHIEKVRRTFNLIKKYKMEQRVYWVDMSGNFDLAYGHPTLPEVAEISRCFGIKQAIRVVILWILGVLPFFKIQEHNWNVLYIS